MALTFPLALIPRPPPSDPLERAVADLLLLGFYGKDPRALPARLLARQIRDGEVGGVFFVSDNVAKPEALRGLVQMMQPPGRQPLIAIDHEGGLVQRLKAEHGFSRLPSAQDMARLHSPEAARGLYAGAAAELAAAGFNLSLGPVLDLCDPQNVAIGQAGRAYHEKADQVARYGAAFTEPRRGCRRLIRVSYAAMGSV
ncbi:glycoside hydrolase family 3 N-terminal domain-containing protein, partial [Falsigemmobacter faecalis]